MTLKGGTSQACAACKYQRRRCTSECPLAPYFPPDQPKLFQNAHKLFGVSNILKILKKLDPDQKATAMWSIMYQANERDRDPVHGCLGKICHLRYQIWHAEQELLSLLAHLDFYRQQQQQHANANPNPNPNPNPAQGLDLVMAPPAAPPDPSCYVSADANNSMWAPLAQAEAAAAALFDQPQQQQPLEVVPEYDEMPFFDTMDDRQSYIDTKDAYDSSSEESVLKEGNDQSIEHIVDNELKNAAACLTLTSVN